MQFKYNALQIHQTRTNKPLVLFSAKASEIDLWAGVPQKKRFGSGEETAGFNREENQTRIQSLSEFYSNESNIIQNPLLCATRSLPFAATTFMPLPACDAGADECLGVLTIDIPDFDAMPLKDILARVRGYLEHRVPSLQGIFPDEDVVTRLKAKAEESGEIPSDDLSDHESDDEESGEDTGDASSVLFQESHIVDFWQEIAARHEILKPLGDGICSESFLGFSREAMLSYLRPVVLVDGQHRLRGALKAARNLLDRSDFQDEVEQRICQGEDAAEVERSIISRESRRLPVSLLLCDDPAEQVFQFVVVNQKAVPIGRPLLGTIVSTTLSNEEMGNVASRLKAAGVQLEESQAITYLIRHPDSPFHDLVERGMTGDAQHLLKWNVFASLVGVFRELEGGRLFGEPNDYAQLWRERHLEQSMVVADFEAHEQHDGHSYWRMLDGPWRDVFIRFWTCVRDVLGSTADPDKYNYWGRPRDSNLFNKVSLSILTADFFQFLCEKGYEIDSVEDVSKLVSEWLEYVNIGYFDKDWDLSGVKKDSTGIREQWASLWSAYRKRGGKLPDRRHFRIAKK